MVSIFYKILNKVLNLFLINQQYIILHVKSTNTLILVKIKKYIATNIFKYLRFNFFFNFV